MEKKVLYVEFSGTQYQFTAQPIEHKAGEPLRFMVDMYDNNPAVLEYRGDYWQQTSGRQIYTDIAIGMGYTIQRNFPELF